MKKNLVILGDALDRQYAGIYRMTYEFINALSTHTGQEINIFLIANKEHNFEGKIHQINTKSDAQSSVSRAYKYFVTYPKFARELNADFVLEPAHFGPFGLPAEIKRITFIHDLTPLLFPKYHDKLSAFLQKSFLPSILRRAELVLCPSTQTKKDILHYYSIDEKKIFQVTPGSNNYLSIPENKNYLFELGITVPYFLHVGTIEPRKNLLHLVKAYESYKSKFGSKTQLVLAGKKGWNQQELYDYIASSKYKKDIILTGFVKDEFLSTLYLNAQAHILTSKYEGFGLSAQDSLDLGIPTLLPRHSAFEDALKSKGVFYKLDSIDDLVSKMAETNSMKPRHAELRTWEISVRQFLSRLETL